MNIGDLAYPGARVGSTIDTVTTSTFDDQVLRAEGAVVVEFMSYGCTHCRVLEPVLREVARRVAPGEKIFRVNVPVEEALASSYGIQGTPTLVMFLDGQEVGRVEGPTPALATVMAAVTGPFAGVAT